MAVWLMLAASSGGNDLGLWAQGDMVSKNLLPKIVSIAWASEQVQNALEQWPACMKKHGFQVKTLSDAAAAAGTPAEKDTAVADATCRVDASLRTTFENRFDAAAATELDQSGGLLAEYVRMVERTAMNASKIS